MGARKNSFTGEWGSRANGKGWRNSKRKVERISRLCSLSSFSTTKKAAYGGTWRFVTVAMVAATCMRGCNKQRDGRRGSEGKGVKE
ncbi:hypothetical protein ACH5RR_001568 [Cinchona calisaya]|uniref:Uncharacterized protein n=1 Tax=Cinchona calisaya TaxID=153742 RepID=A0ABD3B3R5_9GENT